MNPRNIVLILTTVIASFGLGWFGSLVTSPNQGTEGNDRQIDTLSRPASVQDLHSLSEDSSPDEFRESFRGIVAQAGTPGSYGRVREFGSLWAESDIDATLQAIEQAQSPEISDGLFHGAVDAVGTTDPLLFLEWLQRDSSDQMLKKKWVGSLLRRWAELDGGAAMQWALERSTDPEISDSIPFLLLNMAQIDPGVAKRKAAGLTGKVRIDAVRAVATTLANDDRMAALEWLTALPADRARVSAFGEIVEDWARVQPREAGEFVSGLPESREKFAAAETTAVFWAAVNPEEALRWVDGEFSDRQAADLMGPIIESWAVGKPTEAADFLDQIEFTDPSYQQRYTGMVARSWARSSPSDALKWLVDRPLNSYDDRAIYEVSYQWIRADPSQAADWIHGMPPGNVQDDALLALVAEEKQEDPAGALEIAATMSSNNRRTQAAKSALGPTADREGVAVAIEMLKTSALNQADQEDVIKFLKYNYKK